MLKYDMVKEFSGDEVFEACRKRCGRDIEGILNETYCPPQDGAIWVSLPPKDECYDPECYSPEEMILFETLHEDGGLEWGEGCYIAVSY